MRIIETVTVITNRLTELNVILVLGLIDAIYHALFGRSPGGGDRGDDES